MMLFQAMAFLVVACKGPIEVPVEEGKVPVLKSCTIEADSYVSKTTDRVTLTFSAPINLVDGSKISLVDNLNNKLQITNTVANLNINIRFDNKLEPNRKYTLSVGSGTVKAIQGGKENTSYSLVFHTEKELIPVDKFDIDPNLITPNPSSEAKALYDYLKEGFGKRSLSGSMAKYTVQLNEAQWMKEKTGKYPAIACFDLMNAGRGYNWDEPYTTMITNAKEWHSNKGIVSIMWHWRDPSRKTEAFYSMKTNNDPRTGFDVSKVHDTSSEEYKAMVEDIDYIASFLKELADAGIPVLWRPLHEAQGGWFWWGAKEGKDAVALWNLLYDRLVNHHGLNNLIWVWTITNNDGAEDWYPGRDKVDIVGADVYRDHTNHASYKDYFDFVASVSEGHKLVALSECGAVPSVENMLAKGDTWLYFMPWYGDFTQDDKHNGAGFMKTLFDSDFVITRDEL